MSSAKNVLRHVTIDTAKRKRNCAAHMKGPKTHRISAGETHLVVSEEKSFNYCLPAATDLLDRAQAELAALRRQLGI
jgi:hypothetical protein